MVPWDVTNSEQAPHEFSGAVGRLKRIRSALLQFAVGLKLKSEAEHVIVDAEDAPIAALKVKAERPEALIIVCAKAESTWRRS